MINDICILLIAHFIGDFLCQNRYIATRKSEDFLVLTFHVIIYSTVMYLVSSFFLSNKINVDYFNAFNFIAHLITDFLTSRLNKFNYKRHGVGYLFFSGIGLDQLIHSLTIILSYNYFIK